MNLIRIDKLFNFEKGSLQSSKCVAGNYHFITASAEWKTHNEYTYETEALVFAAAASGSLGRTHYVNGKFIASDLCFILSPKDLVNLPVDLQFYHIIFNSLREDVVKNTKSGTSKEAISLASFGKYEIPYLDIDMQIEIKNQLVTSEKIKEKLSTEFTSQLDILKKLRQQILQDAVQGKLLNSSLPRKELTTTPAFGHPSSGGGDQIRNFGQNSSPPREGEYPQGEGVIDYKKISNLPLLKTFRKELRSHLTPAEATLWTLLSNRKLQGRKFRRQHSVGNYILDFFCPEEKLAVELDGEVHMNTIAEQYDRDRDIFLQYTGIKVLRFENRMAFDLPESLLREIEENFGWDKKITTPAFGHPSLKGGEHEQMEDARVLLEKIRAEKQQLIAQGKIKKEKTLPEIKPKEIPFNIPDNWVWCRLGDILTEIKYGTSKSCDYDISKNACVLRIPNVSSGRLNGEDLKYTNLSQKEKTELSLEKDDILIIRSNGSRELVGRTVLVTNEFVGFSYAGYLVRLRFNKELSNPQYLLKCCSSPFFRELIETPLRTTVGINNINSTEISELLIPLPPQPEQHRIVIKILQLMKLCDEMEQSIQQNQKYTQELLQVALKEALEPNTNQT